MEGVKISASMAPNDEVIGKETPSTESCDSLPSTTLMHHLNCLTVQEMVHTVTSVDPTASPSGAMYAESVDNPLPKSNEITASTKEIVVHHAKRSSKNGPLVALHATGNIPDSAELLYSSMKSKTPSIDHELCTSSDETPRLTNRTPLLTGSNVEASLHRAYRSIARTSEDQARNLESNGKAMPAIELPQTTSEPKYITTIHPRCQHHKIWRYAPRGALTKFSGFKCPFDCSFRWQEHSWK